MQNQPPKSRKYFNPLIKIMSHSTEAFEEQIHALRKKIDLEILSFPASEKVALFHDPINYINSLPGKRFRPILTVLSGLIVNGNTDNLIFAAAAIELLHNFTLVHDDIMDQDDTRRGKPTVHKKWDLGTAILAGDGLIGLAYKKLLQTQSKKSIELLNLFTDAMLEICEGQAMDKSFETENSVSKEAYLKMISKKTAVLIRLACKTGAIVGGGSNEQIFALESFGYQIGMGFQIQDDMLDVLADEDKLGKKVGSDLAMNKKTILSIMLAEKSKKNISSISSIKDFRQLLEKEDVIGEAQRIIDSYFNGAAEQLKKLPPSEYTDLLEYFTGKIKNREK